MSPAPLVQPSKFGVILVASLCHIAKAGNTIDCIENTGGSCLSNDCFSWRGQARCDLGRCFCTSSTCSGGDGVCTATPYRKVANGTQYRIRNARCPEYYMDAVRGGGALDLRKRISDEIDKKFTLTMPSYAGGESPLLAPLFLIESVRRPKEVIQVTSSTNDGETQWMAEVKNVDGALGGMGSDPTVMDLGMMITLAPDASPDGDVPVMLSSYRYQNKYLYCASMRVTLSVHENDPGTGGYWFFEPPLPAEMKERLQRYVGPRCTMNCGHDINISAAVRGGGVWAFLAVLVFSWAVHTTPKA